MILKRLLRTTWVQAALGAALAGYMSFVKATTRWEVRGREVVEPIWAARKGVIGCVWHSRVLMTIAGWPKGVQPATMLVSRSPDGEFVVHAAKRLGIGVIRGSARNPRKSTKEKGGVAAFRAMAEHIAAGGCMALTPDGPRGPRMRISAGAVRLARSTQAPMLAFAWSTSSRVVFDTWDRFIVPLPFARGVIVWKGPIAPPPPDDPAALETARQALETAMNEAAREADEATGCSVIEPAALRGERLAGEPAAAERSA
jgi:lysophospholipid acyltransferase (LPLAT)-like uncharacterized protein